MSRAEAIKRYDDKQALLKESGAIRMPVVPYNEAAIRALAARSGYSCAELLAMNDIQLGRVVWVEVVAEELGDEPDRELLPDKSGAVCKSG